MLSLIVRLLAGGAVLVVISPFAAKADEPYLQQTAAAQTTAPATPAPGASTTAEPPPICTDRPTKSDVICTVDPGHFQYESDLINVTTQRVGGVTTDTYLVTNPTLKYGVSKDLDLQVNVAPYEVVQTHDKFGDETSLGGVGDVYLRLKYNFYNSLDGKLSIDTIPYIKAPLARYGVGNGQWEAGEVLTIAYKLTDVLTVSTQPEVDDLKNLSGDSHHLGTAQLLNVSYGLPQNVTVFAELWGDWSFDPSGTIRQYSADTAIAWGVTRSVQIDAGLNFGLNRVTPAVQAYMGVSQKF